MIRWMFASLLLFCATAALGQGAKSVFAELGGPGLASFNYDMRFSHRQDGIGGRIGVGGLYLYDAGAIFVPIGVNYLLGKNNRDYFELGAGVTYTYASSNSYNDPDDIFRNTFGHFNFGYRLQPANGGFMFRASINPLIGSKVYLPYFGGVSFGYKF